jgi:leucyl-tRNA synthetase
MNLPGAAGVGVEADRKLEADGRSERRIRYALAAEALSILLRTLYPIAPHVTHTLWSELGFARLPEFGEIVDAPWPRADSSALASDEITLVVQVNGKLRGHIAVSPWADKEEIEMAALADANVRKFVAGNAVKRVVVVPGKLVNVVV